ATMAKLSIGQMIRYGYSRSFAAGIVASAGTLGSMIPPSVILVLYAITTGESTGEMLIAGVIPGILSAIAYATFISVRARSLVTPQAAPASVSVGGPSDGPDLQPSLNEALADATAEARATAATTRTKLPYRGVFRAGVLFTIVIGGIYSGIFTP